MGFMLHAALSAVPPAQPIPGAASVRQLGQRRHPRWVGYAYALVMSVAMLVQRELLVTNFGESSLLLLFSLPILLSAMIGGVGPGLLATSVAALSIIGPSFSPWARLVIDHRYDQMQLVMAVIYGVIVSVLAELLQRSLRKAEIRRQLLDAVIAGASDAIFVKDAFGRYLLVNEAAAQFVGTAAQDILGKSDFEIFPEASALLIQERDRESLASGSAHTHEERVQTMDGKTIYWLPKARSSMPWAIARGCSALPTTLPRASRQSAN